MYFDKAGGACKSCVYIMSVVLTNDKVSMKLLPRHSAHHPHQQNWEALNDLTIG